MQPYGDLIHDALSAFTNEQDSGIAILTPMCLLIGLYQPLHYSNDASLSEFRKFCLSSSNQQHLCFSLITAFSS